MDHWDRKHLWSHLSRCRRQSYLIQNVEFPMSFEWVRRMGDKKNVSYQFIMAHFSFSRYFGYIIYFSRIEIRIDSLASDVFYRAGKLLQRGLIVVSHFLPHAADIWPIIFYSCVVYLDPIRSDGNIHSAVVNWLSLCRLKFTLLCRTLFFFTSNIRGSQSRRATKKVFKYQLSSYSFICFTHSWLIIEPSPGSYEHRVWRKVKYIFNTQQIIEVCRILKKKKMWTNYYLLIMLSSSLHLRGEFA